ncbi:uncharacterized protein LOC106708564 [Papilio machaon]|uniref:uncharacterized protein LOC106708564 n=1 Tax=Papilio machaon TaxID=76193 RepID=UPI001E66612B|nr:uncharacterized protein LOC106708564 [Papilio machaon]
MAARFGAHCCSRGHVPRTMSSVPIYLVLAAFIHLIFIIPFAYLEIKFGNGNEAKDVITDPFHRNKIINNYLKADDVKTLKKIKMKARALSLTVKPRGSEYGARGLEEEPSGFQQDAIMNLYRPPPPFVRRHKNEAEDYLSSSSSVEMQNWKEEWKDIWLAKKLEALNSSIPKGDTVNMAAARPWGVPCGDPNQHDMPWGTCMLPMECEAEYRIYRGDFSCGRTTFVCCALQLSTYDMYGGFDISFQDSSLETDSEEKRMRDVNSRERRERKKKREKRKRKRDRDKRKRKIKKNIQNIIKEIRKILDRAYKNGTAMRKKKTKQLKRFIKELKKQYRKDRQSVKDIHEMEIIKVDAALMKKLNQIRVVNRNFMKNATFREIIINGTMTKKQARMLLESYPDLEGYMTRRAAPAGAAHTPADYDIEYGYFYY